MTIPQSLDLAIGHHQANRLAEAEAIYRQILAEEPNNAKALHLLGLIAYQTGHFPMAVELFRISIQEAPANAEARGHLGLALMRMNQIDQAISAFRHAVLIQRDLASAHNNLGNALLQRGLLDEAAESLTLAMALSPESPEGYTSMGNLYYARKQLGEAIAAHRKAIALRPVYAEAHNNLGNALSAAGQTDEAAAELQRAIEIESGFAEAHSNLGNVRRERGEIAEALECFSRASELTNFDGFHSNYIYCMHFDPRFDTPAICKELGRWNKIHAEPVRQFILPHANDRNPKRRLRIGYVSPDFREHVVGWNLLPLLREHDHEQFEVFCYSSVSCPDGITAKLAARADVWRNLVGIDNTTAADIVRRDQIDILIDLSLHSANHRLPLFALRSAPLQFSYLGYCGSTGLSAIDYRFSDPHIDAIEWEALYSEKTIRLPRTYWCYQPGGPAPAVNALPAQSAGHITFGCLNSFAKVSGPAIDLWIRILSALPGSRLILHAEEGSHQQRLLNQFEKSGVNTDRVEFIVKQPFAQYLRNYGRIDIALDPFPYGGGITSCDALYMGVPLVTLEGNTATGRGGKSILSNLGLSRFVAKDPEEYLRVAVHLAGDLSALANLRSGLRALMEQSPLMRATEFARDVERAYREAWQRWCGARA
ncbi:MAG: tetratricopeptide repeat protein [Planctomycetota bacterium]|nr:tetratricopeptide repeat protein [Planctomycetota bacterium]